jgi:hypothetical protein
MECPHCHIENKAGRKSCAACGQALPFPCSQCGFINDPGDKFCGGCGQALTSSSTSPPHPRQPLASLSQSLIPNPQPLTPNPQVEAEACFHKAIDIARRLGAKSWELRAVTSLSRLWQQQGKTEEARRMLAAVYGWFTEGFDTADLQEAKALLAALS